MLFDAEAEVAGVVERLVASSASGSAVWRNSSAISSRRVTFAPMRVALADVELADSPLGLRSNRHLPGDLLEDVLGVGEFATTFADAHVDDDLLDARVAHLVEVSRRTHSRSSVVLTREVLVDDDDVLFDRLEARPRLRDDHVVPAAGRDMNLLDFADFARVGPSTAVTSAPSS